MLKGKTIVLGVAGGIAAFKAASLASALTKAGASVHVIMTASAQKFITPLTFQSLTKHPVLTDTFTEPDPSELAHIALADKADLIVVAPTTANVIGKVAGGIADDMLTTTIMATLAPVLFAVAMNVNMYNNPIVQDNILYLQGQGYHFAEPAEGYLACGWTGKGRLMEPEDIVRYIEAFFAARERRMNDLGGQRVLVTAGRTAEPVDLVTVQHGKDVSIDKVGHYLAERASARGAQVTFVVGTSEEKTPEGIEALHVERAQDMQDAVLSRLEDADVLLSAARVSDYRPVLQTQTEGAGQTAVTLLVEYVRNPDVLRSAEVRKREGQVLVGLQPGTDGTVTVRFSNGRELALAAANPREAADLILDHVCGAGERRTCS
jgi:phosphopantothenoylcysteine decarboxylase / phosphopantothenate---cysteine ligase